MQEARGHGVAVGQAQPSPHNMQVGPPPPAARPSPAHATGASSSSSSSSSRSRVVGDYIVEHRIGAGSFASVWKAYHRNDRSMQRAIKSVSKEKLSTNKKHEDNLQQEIKIMQRINHPNIVRLYETKTTERHHYLILEYCAGGDLSKWIRRHGAIPEPQALYWLGQLALGLKYLRAGNLIHRDLKPQNLLLDSDGPDAVLKIADFGFARALESPDDMTTTLCGSPLYMAPEILGYKSYDASADLWSVGGILFEMVTGKPPFTGSNHIQLLNRINTTELKFPPDIKLSSNCVSLLTGLLKRNPRERITFLQFFAHPYVVEAIATAEAAQRRKEEAARAAAAQQQQQQQQQQALAAQPPLQPSSTPPTPVLTPGSFTPQGASPAPPSSAPPPRSDATAILKSLSTTPPQPQPPSLQQRQQQEEAYQPRSNSNLYGSSPAQPVPQALQALPSQQSSTAYTPQRFSPSLPSFLPGSSPPSMGTLPTQYNQTQHYQKAPSAPQQQQIGFHTSPPAHAHSHRAHSPSSPNGVQQQAHGQHGHNATVQHPPRPLSRHLTPQGALHSLRNSGGGQSADGSSSSYVVIDPEANSGSAAPAQSPSHGHQPAQQAHSHAPVPLDSASEFARVKTLTNRAQLIASMGDQRLAALRSPALLQLLEDVENADPDEPLVRDADQQPTAQSALLALSGQGASLQEQLAAVLALYLKALQQLAAIVPLPAQVLAQLQQQSGAAAGADGDAISADVERWDEVARWLPHLMQRYLTRSQLVRRTIEELEQSAAGGASASVATVRVGAISSRRGSVASSSQCGSGSGSGGEEKSQCAGSSSSSDLRDPSGGVVSRSPPLVDGSAPLHSSRLSLLSTACAEKQLYDESLQRCQDAMHEEFLGCFAPALRHYRQAAKLLDSLLAEPAATDQDRAELGRLRRMVAARIHSVQPKAEAEKAEAAKAQAANADATPAPLAVN